MFRNVFQLLGAYSTKTPNAPRKEVTSSFLSAHLCAHNKALWYGSRAGRAGGSDGRLFLRVCQWSEFHTSKNKTTITDPSIYIQVTLGNLCRSNSRASTKPSEKKFIRLSVLLILGILETYFSSPSETTTVGDISIRMRSHTRTPVPESIIPLCPFHGRNTKSPTKNSLCFPA